MESEGSTGNFTDLSRGLIFSRRWLGRRWGPRRWSRESFLAWERGGPGSHGANEPDSGTLRGFVGDRVSRPAVVLSAQVVAFELLEDAAAIQPGDLRQAGHVS